MGRFRLLVADILEYPAMCFLLAAGAVGLVLALAFPGAVSPLVPTRLTMPQGWLLLLWPFADGRVAPWVVTMVVAWLFGPPVEDLSGSWRCVRALLLAWAFTTGLHWITAPMEPLRGASFACFLWLLAGMGAVPPGARSVGFPPGIPLRGALWILMIAALWLVLKGGSPFWPQVVGPAAAWWVAGLRLPGWGGSRGGAPRTGGNRGRLSMGNPGRSANADDRYDDPHWRLDQ